MIRSNHYIMCTISNYCILLALYMKSLEHHIGFNSNSTRTLADSVIEDRLIRNDLFVPLFARTRGNDSSTTKTTWRTL
jgi:hypothetical protein